MFKYLRYPLYIFMLVVSIMSGPFALLREAIAIFDPQRVQTFAVLGHWLLGAFIISTFSLVIMERNKVSELEKQLKNSLPKLSDEFNIFSVAPAGDHDEDSVIIIMATITNTGAPSIVSNFKVLIKKEDKEEIPGEDIILAQGPMLLEGEGLKLVCKEEDNLPKKGISNPIPTGGALHGWHIVRAQKITPDEIYKKGTIIVFSYEDVTGKLYATKKMMDKAVSKLIDGTKLQKPYKKMLRQ